jgi:hypothetical protein
MPLTKAGVLEEVLDPVPNWPDVPRPQHLMVPSDNVAQVNPIPAETEVASVMPVTALGLFEEELLPFPSAPESPFPQHSIVPSTTRAHV